MNLKDKICNTCFRYRGRVRSTNELPSEHIASTGDVWVVDYTAYIYVNGWKKIEPNDIDIVPCF